MTSVTSVTFAIETDERGCALVLRDGHPQSFVNLDDPTDLAFEYIALLALLVDTLLPAGPLRATHIGGAGLTLPRWLEHSRPGSPQIVLEPDVALTELVRRELPLPRRHRIRVRAVDGATGIAALATGSADLIVLDAYADGRVPADLVTLEFFAECRRVLTDDGLLLANLADDRDFVWVPRVAAGARTAFGDIAWVALTEVLKGRRFGNGILVASAGPIDVAAVDRELRRMPWPCGIRGQRELASRRGGSAPFTAADAKPSPEPPDPSRWR